MRQKNRKNSEKTKKTETLRRNSTSTVMNSVQSVLRPEEWERFVKEVGFRPAVKE